MRSSAQFLLWFICLGTASLAHSQSFSQATPQATKDSITLTWSAPMKREDGSLLSPSELSGYQIYYTVEETGESIMVEIDDISTTQYEFRDLAPGNYFFAITAVDSKGEISELSDMVTARVE
jgi:hypothetical protein